MEYNDEIQLVSKNQGLRAVNRFAMDHTYKICFENETLKKCIQHSIEKECVIPETISKYGTPIINVGETTDITVTTNRSFEAARHYSNQKVVVLNFANNHHIGGSPWTSFAQEESLCRCSTLYPCLEAKKKEFYYKHSKMFENGEIDEYGNDDIIYTPDIVVFKTDESIPLMMEENDWYKVDVLTCAAPNLGHTYNIDYSKLTTILYSRIEAILKVAQVYKADVLILGAFGCGAFHNPPDLVAEIFNELLKKYYFRKVEFAVYCGNDKTNYEVFKRTFTK